MLFRSTKMATINIRVDENVKNQATALFESLGLDMTTALNIFLRQSINCGGIPFAIKKPRWVVSSEEDIYMKLKEAEDEIKNGEPTVDASGFMAGLKSKYEKLL